MATQNTTKNKKKRSKHRKKNSSRVSILLFAGILAVVLLLVVAAVLRVSSQKKTEEPKTPASSGLVIDQSTVTPAPTPAAVTPSPTPVPTPEPVRYRFADAKVGDVVTFGSYEQDNNKNNGPEAIRWIVLDRKDGMVLLLSEKCLDCKKYNDTYREVTWETSTLRIWLNNNFLNDAFTESEQKEIAENPDKVTLLSVQEASNYLKNDADRRAAPTAYALAQGVWTTEGYQAKDGGNACWWWLKDRGDNASMAAGVGGAGGVRTSGNNVHMANDGVRPAIWVPCGDTTADELAASRPVHYQTTVRDEDLIIGETYTLGSYDQDNNKNNGPEPITWIVLEKENGKALLISQKALDVKPYNNSHNAVTWETSTLRTWLNDQFLNEAFTDAEKAQLAGSPDLVSLLTKDQASRLFRNDSARRCGVTATAKAKGVITMDDYKTEDGSASTWWWLKTEGDANVKADGIGAAGGVREKGNNVNMTNDAVRPVIWISYMESIVIPEEAVPIAENTDSAANEVPADTTPITN